MRWSSILRLSTAQQPPHYPEKALAVPIVTRRPLSAYMLHRTIPVYTPAIIFPPPPPLSVPPANTMHHLPNLRRFGPLKLIPCLIFILLPILLLVIVFRLFPTPIQSPCRSPSGHLLFVRWAFSFKHQYTLRTPVRDMHVSVSKEVHVHLISDLSR